MDENKIDYSFLIKKFGFIFKSLSLEKYAKSFIVVVQRDEDRDPHSS